MSWKTRLLNRFRGIFRSGPLERWLRKRTQGRRTNAFWVRLLPPEHSYPKGSWRSVEKNGSKFELDLSNSPDHCEYFGYVADAHERLLELVTPESVVVDIGANIGLVAINLARKASRGTVIAFEPDPGNFARLERHIALNGIANIVARPLGIGPKEAVYELYEVVDSNSGMNRIITQGSAVDHLPHKRINVVPLAKGIEGIAVDRVDVIKLDVEGFELEVLKGCGTILQQHRPVLFVELDDANLRDNGGDARTLVRHLEDLNYQVLDPATRAPVASANDLSGCHMDILCLPTPG